MLRQGHIILHIKNGTERVLRSLVLHSTVLLCGMAALTALTACNSDDDIQFKPETVDDQMLVKASADTVRLSAQNAAETAITFQWNAATPRKYYSFIEYYVQISELGSKDHVAALKRLDDDATSYSMTQKELNSVLTGWGYGPGTVLDLKFTLMAKPFNTQKFLMPETSTCTFVAVSY